MINILMRFRNALTVACIAFCFSVSYVSIISYFTIDEFLYNGCHVKKYELLKLQTVWKYDPVYFNATWVSDEEILTQDYNGNIILFDVNKIIKSVLAFNSMKHMKYCYKYELSADKKYLLIAYNVNTKRSNLSIGNYDVINVKTGRQVTLRDKNHRPREIMSAKWSPTSSSLAIVADYNIYYIPTVTKPNKVIQMTFNGSKDFYNGIPDWIYAEEIFGSTQAMSFSDGGTKLAYITFDDTSVSSTCLQEYGTPNTMYDQHSSVFRYHYPKVDDPNPTVELIVRVLNAKNESKPIPIKPIKHYANESILYKVVWSGDEHLFVMWMNRIQNESHLVHYYIADNKAEVIELLEFRQENGWLDFRGSPMIGPENQIALIYPTEQDDGDSYGHVCVLQTNGNLRAMTDGKFEVTKLIKWDFKSNYIYYLANTKSHPEQQHVYRVLMDLDQRHVTLECLTCDEGCTFNDAVLSEKNTYYSHICRGSNIVPYVNIMKTNNGDKIVAWETNTKLHKELSNVRFPNALFLTVPLVDGYKARVKLLIPPTIDISADKKYPLLIFTYGGPTSNVALDEFSIDLNTYLSARCDIVVAKVDGRGTQRRGYNTLYANYMQLGTAEIDDQIIVAKYLQNKLPYVDDRKTGIWGWGYGGYIAAMVLAKDTENIFQYALSVAPITDWIYYDSMYTERLMGSYKDNFQGYRNASLIENAEGLRHKNYMVIHGMLDENVNFQHSAMLSKELQHKAILFRQQFYPDESHKLSNVKHHLYQTIISYISQCLV